MAHDKAYYAAEKKIQQALQSGATELDLSGISLTEIPKSLGKLTHLQSLNLSGNELVALPDWIEELTHLRSLDISSNPLTALPDSLRQLTQLTELNLSYNQLTTLPDSLAQLTQLTKLDLSHNQLTALPESLGQLPQLQSLSLSGNKLTTLPESLGQLMQLQSLDLSSTQLTTLPEWLGQLTQLQSLDISFNQLTALPESLGKLTQLQSLILLENLLPLLPDATIYLSNLQTLHIGKNKFTSLPSCIKELRQLRKLYAWGNLFKSLPEWLAYLENLDELTIGVNPNITLVSDPIRKLSNLTSISLNSIRLTYLPDWISELTNLTMLQLDDNQLTDIPPSLSKLEHLHSLGLGKNPLNPELAAAYKQGLEAVKAYLRAKAEGQIILNEAKLILVGEGEVGKSCLMDALLGNPWREHDTTHGIEITRIKATEPDSNKVITLNGWDFGGQRIYRPTHQLFFSAPAVYLVVWKPREGPQQGFVREWIQLIKRREPTAKILVVATHGGPQQRQPDIDRQELWDLFGKETVIDFFFVDSKPDENGQRKGIDELKNTIARVAASLPEVGRSVPKHWEDVHKVLENSESTYLPLEQVLAICHEHKMEEDEARLFVTIEHRLGTLIHYQNDPTLRDIVILRPDWLATAMSYVLDDEETRKAHGLVKFSRLSQLWNDPARSIETRYPEKLHSIFLRLMERFDLSYRVADLAPNGDADPQSLIAQLVPDNRPENMETGWPAIASVGDLQQTQICRIVDKQNGQSAPAEGLFYQLIVRLHKYSLGRVRYVDSVHWQKGLVLDNAYNGRAFLENKGNDVHITVRAPYPERFLTMLTEEVKFLVESFWEGLRCDVMVPCLNPKPCLGLFEVEKLIENKKRGRPEQPCPICNEWQNIDHLLLNAPAARSAPKLEILSSKLPPPKAAALGYCAWKARSYSRLLFE